MERKGDRLSICWSGSLPRWLQRPVLGHVEARSFLPRGWEWYSVIWCWDAQVFSRQLDWSRAVGIQAGAHVGCWHNRRWLYPLHHHAHSSALLTNFLAAVLVVFCFWTNLPQVENIHCFSVPVGQESGCGLCLWFRVFDNALQSGCWLRL